MKEPWPQWLKNVARDIGAQLKRGQPMACAGAAALVLAGGSVYFFTYATNHWGKEITPPTLLYPYMATASVFFTTCIWIVATVLHGMQDADQRTSAWRWAVITFLVSFAALAFLGLAGAPGANAVWRINWYLFGGPAQAPRDLWRDFWPTLRMPFTYIAAAGNAASLGTLALLTAACQYRAQDAAQGHRVAEVHEAARGLQRLMSLASALMVTTTLTIYLLFGTSDQIGELQKAHPDATPASGSAAAASSAKSTAGKDKATPLATALDRIVVKLPVACEQSASPASTATVPESAPTSPTECHVVATVSEGQKKPSASAAYMALVVGLSLTGVLFILFFSSSAAVDDAYAALLNDARKKNASAMSKDRFSVKTWREEQGIQEEAATDKVLKALALLAPALTGVLTLIVGT